jgi:hypothetical protein
MAQCVVGESKNYSNFAKMLTSGDSEDKKQLKRISLFKPLQTRGSVFAPDTGKLGSEKISINDIENTNFPSSRRPLTMQ